MRVPSYGYRGRSRSRGGLGGRLPIILLVIGGLAFYWFSNQKTGITGRNQMITMSLAEEVQLGDQSYAQILQQENVLCAAGALSCPAEAGEVVNIVETIGQDIARAAVEWERDLQAEGKLPSWGALADKFEWEFKVIQSDTPNAFCLPGGKVAFYTGILPTAANRDGIAVIMGHEVGHALARHGAERMSQQKVMQMGQMAVGASMSGTDASTQRMVMGAFGMGAQMGVLLPYSRNHESEADLIGLELSTRACYDPREAPALWMRMAELGGGQRQPEMLSTHPDPEARAAAFERVMPRYIEMYERKCGPLPAR